MVRKRISKIGYYLVIILISFISMLPFLWMISTSFKSRGALMTLPIEWIPKNPTFDAYIKVFTRFPFARAIGNSFFIARKTYSDLSSSMFSAIL